MTESQHRAGTPAIRDSRDERIEQVIGRLLQLGVLTAAVVVAIGGVLVLVQYGHMPASFQLFQGEESSLKSIGGIVQAVLRGNSRAIVQLGLVLLIATPVARVALTFGAFVVQRDRLYILTTGIVLTLLLYGLLWGRA